MANLASVASSLVNKPQTVAPPAGGNKLQDLLALLIPLLTGQQQQQSVGNPDVALLRELRNDPIGDRNKSWTSVGPGGGLDMAKSAGYFNAPKVWENPDGTANPNFGVGVRVPPRTDAASNPYAFGALGPGTRVPNTWVLPGMFPSLRDTGRGGLEGMIDPNAPDAIKYSDQNMFGIAPTTLPPGVVASDGTTQYRRKKGLGDLVMRKPKLNFSTPRGIR